MSRNPKVIALLPLKRNSERVPNKNFRLLHGKPLYRWVLDMLLSVSTIDEIIINSDAIELLRAEGLPESSKLVLRDRDPSICGDAVSMNAVIADDLANSNADVYLMTHTTNPFLSADTVMEALETFLGTPKVDSVFTVNKHQTRFYREDASAINHSPGTLIQTQNLEPWFEENSCLYVFSKKSFEAADARIGLQPRMLVTPKIESFDIDDMEDWEVVEAMAPAVFSSRGVIADE